MGQLTLFWRHRPTMCGTSSLQGTELLGTHPHKAGEDDAELLGGGESALGGNYLQRPRCPGRTPQ